MIHGKILFLKPTQAFAFVFLLSFSVVANAQNFADDPCDYDGYYKSLEARAWLEAQREITQNQNLIFKADSVLEYTCFDQFAGVLANSGVAPTSLDTVLGPALESYNDSNFAHSFLGGRLDPAVATNDYKFTGSITPSADYVCESMNAVWTEAKCMNFVQNPAYDGFFTFEQYAQAAAANDDKRFLPTQCASTADYAGNIADAIPVSGGGLWQRDDVKTYFDLIYPTNDSCGGSNSMISTGAVINRTRNNPKIFREFVCVVPGCHFVPDPSATATSGTGTCER